MLFRSLLIAIYVVAFYACNDTDVKSGGKSKQEDVVNSISFRTYVPKTLKGGTTTISTLETGDGFSVYAYHSGTSPTSYFEDVIFKFDEQGPSCTSLPIYYWPSGSLDFYCFYPTTIKPHATPPFSFYVNIASSSAPQEYIVMTSSPDHNQPSSDSSLNLLFNNPTSQTIYRLQTPPFSA